MPFYALLPFLTAVVLCAEHDLFFKLIPDEYIIFLFASGIPVFLCSGGGLVRLSAGPLLLLIFVLLYNRLNRFIGGADLKLFVCFTVIAGFFKTVLVFSFAFVTAGVFALFYMPLKALFTKKAPREIKKETLPFAPFLLVSLILVML